MVKVQTPLRSNDSTGMAAVEKLKTTVGNLNKLPMLPQAATKAMELINDPNCSMKSLASVIERDPALATGVLKLANSALYRVGRTISSLNLAVVRLGLHECRNLIFAVGMRSLFRNVSKEQKERCETLWQHSFLTACLCRRLNTTMGLGFQGEEFSCGLSHDLGRLLIALGAPDKFPLIDPLDFAEGPHILTREQEGLGVDHCFFGAWFANVNQLPSSLSCACQFHHNPDEALEHQSLVALVAAADDLANHVQREKTIEGYTLEGKAGWPLLVAMDDEEAKTQTLEAMPKLMDESITETESVLGLRIRRDQAEAA